jgi:hypothetical protein
MYEEKTSVDPVFPIKWCYQIDRHIQDYLTACSMDPPDLSLSAKILLRFGNDCESLEARLWNSGSVPDFFTVPAESGLQIEDPALKATQPQHLLRAAFELWPFRPEPLTPTITVPTFLIAVF